jgi:DNA-binding transcriptional MerR regulator
MSNQIGGYSMKKANLTVAQVAEVCGCHRNTVLNYERKGLIKAMRDHNNFRKYSLKETLKLKGILSKRIEVPRRS